MKRETVNSESVVAIGYDPESRTLEVEFRGGRVYQYAEVPPEVHAWFLRVPSKGSFVRRVISGYETREVTPRLDADLEASLKESLAKLERVEKE